MSANLKLVHDSSTRRGPVVAMPRRPVSAKPHAARPYRLWDTKNNVQVRWRYYTELRNAHNGAAKEVLWSKIGTTLEVYNAISGRVLGQYTKTVSGIRVWRARNQ